MAERLTRGRRALRAVLQRTTSEEVAARCRVAGRTVRYWAQEREPDSDNKLKLAQLYGIPAGAWGAVVPPAFATKDDWS